MGEKNKSALLLVIMIYISIIIYTPVDVIADGYWERYVNYSIFNDISSAGDYLWCTSDVGIVRVDKCNMTTKQYTVADGLASNETYGVAIGPDGLVWCGSTKGLCCFNGKTWKTYTEDDGLVQGVVGEIKFSSDGVMWCRTAYGVSRYEGTAFTTYYEYVGINSIALDPNDNLWIAGSMGLTYYDGKEWITYTQVNGVSIFFNAIEFDQDGILWINGLGLHSFDGLEWITRPSVTSDDLYIGDNGDIWIPHGPGLVTQYNGEEFIEYRTELWPVWQFHRKLTFDDEGFIWCTGYKGLYRFNGSQWELFTFSDVPTSNILYDCAEGLDGTMWFATDNAGLCGYDRSRWKTIGVEDSLFFGPQYLITVDSNGNIWCPRNDIINRYDWETWHVSKLKWYASVTSFVPDNDGGIWACIGERYGTQPDDIEYRLIHSRDGVWDVYTYSDGLPGANIESMTLSQDGLLWCATKTEGIFSFNGEHFTYYRESEGLSSNKTTSILIDSEGFLWVGTRTGLCQYDGITSRVFTTSDGLYSNHVIALAIDTRSNVWSVSYTGGVSLYEGEKWRHFTLKDGVVLKKFSALAASKDGSVWFSTKGDGIYRYIYNSQSDVETNEILPATIAITGNYPNPFNPITTIGISLPEAGFVDLFIYNLAGQKIRELMSGTLSEGIHSVVWDGRNSNGLPVSAGVYMSRLTMGDAVTTGKMLLMK